ncbi:MAG: hypothetical protein SVX43_10800 [Cyanobacteriota bacterium]|nr:hypothetical protein [Cyanobacteriota bacterium]
MTEGVAVAVVAVDSRNSANASFRSVSFQRLRFEERDREEIEARDRFLIPDETQQKYRNSVKLE